MKVDRAWLKTQVHVEIEISEETIDWRREFEDSRQNYLWIESELASGNRWAWCSVKVSATWKEFTGTDHLGGCSYENEAAFKAEDGYYPQMIDDCVMEIAKDIEHIYNFHGLWEHDKLSCLLCIAEGPALT